MIPKRLGYYPRLLGKVTYEKHLGIHFNRYVDLCSSYFMEN